eukprot:TRINITY_DN325_c0_g2_i1.p2 TRINITY_DN325_c0_g2~~TRINITY_DN325_c0_g2_i1.p2  ORF type:complete len:257 (-),score=47.73 TRINITY_DN325_c0_g2_i1:157-927(-)
MKTKGAVCYFQTSDCDKHAEWLVRVFEGKMGTKWRGKDDKVMHTCLDINGGQIFMGDNLEFAGWIPEDSTKPVKRGQISFVTLKNVDKFWKNALDAGAKNVEELADQFWGMRFGMFEDPWGYIWGVASVLEDKQLHKLRVKRVHPHAYLPYLPQKGGSAYELKAVEDVKIGGNSHHWIDIGISIALPENTCAHIYPSPGLQENFEAQGSIIDGSFSSSVKVLATNKEDKTKTIAKGTVVALLIIEQCVTPNIQLSE